MFRSAPRLLTWLAGTVLLAGCGDVDKDAARPAPADPAVEDALADPIMTDPDLTSQNQAHAAVAAAGLVDSALPPIDASPEAIAAARDAAQRLVGGPIGEAPDPAAADLAPLRGAVTAAQMAAAARVTRGECLSSIEYTARWAAALPAPLEVYPRGAVEEAAGSDAAGCALRVVHFRTPVPMGDVIAFYSARLAAVGSPAEHLAQGEDHVLRGRKGALAYLVYVRPAEDGLTAADLVVAP
jgi:hypothetical protein